MKINKSARSSSAQRSKSKTSKADKYGITPEPIYKTIFTIIKIPFITKLLSWLLPLLFWVTVDIIRAIKTKMSGKGKVHLYGIWCFVGLPGAGKTMSLVHYLDDIRRKYSDKVIIATNFYYAGEDFHLSEWKQITEEYEKPVIFGYDELQNEFNSRNYRNFPMRLVAELTQNRKGNGKQLVYTTQTFSAVDNNFRNLTTQVVDCKTYLGRMTKCRYYKREFYVARTEAVSIDKKIKIKPMRKEKFIQTDFLRSRYDSFQRLDYIKSLDYEGMKEESKGA